MTKQLLIYERAVPVNGERHRGWSVKAGQDYRFSLELNALPLTTVEFPLAAREFPIVFAGKDDALMPSAIVGVRERHNLFVAKDGSWQADYLPAFLRRYPFVFASTDNGKKFTLCIDEEFSGCNQDDIGERLFDSQGEQTQYLRGVLEFLKAYQAEFTRTQAFCKRLQEMELLEPMQARVNVEGDKQYSLSGFMTINRERLQSLPAEKLSALVRTGELEIAYLHLQSLRNIDRLAKRSAQLRSEVGSMQDAPSTFEEVSEDEPSYTH